MPIYKNTNNKLVAIKEQKVALESDLQKLTEQNLEAVFGLTFVSGSLNKQFSVRVNEQDFYLDTLAFDKSKNSFVIIEYKKDKSFSVIDQGFAYLSAMLNNQAAFVLELNERLNKSYARKDINWEESRIIFISNEFTIYQRNAINFKDLPMYLYEARFYDNGLVEYDPIKPYRTSESIRKISKDKIIQSVTNQVKVYTLDDSFAPNWSDSRELFEQLQEKILKLGFGINENITKHYIAYKALKNGQSYNFAEVVPQANSLKVHLDIPKKELQDDKNISEDVSHVGHWATGNTKFSLGDIDDLDYAVKLIKQSYGKLTI